MTDEEQTKIATTIAAHEQLIAFLLSAYLSQQTPAQRAELASTMAGPQTAGPGVHLTDDLDLADKIAGLVIEQKEAVARIVKQALAKFPRE